MPTLRERVDKHDREIAVIRKLILTGMKMFVKMQNEHVAFRKEMRELAIQQRATARELEAFIRSLRRGSNGHTKGRFDVT